MFHPWKVWEALEVQYCSYACLSSSIIQLASLSTFLQSSEAARMTLPVLLQLGMLMPSIMYVCFVHCIAQKIERRHVVLFLNQQATFNSNGPLF